MCKMYRQISRKSHYLVSILLTAKNLSQLALLRGMLNMYIICHQHIQDAKTLKENIDHATS